jgi:hypothetical protein
MSWTIIVASGQADQLDELMSGAQEIAAQISSPDGTSVVSATSVEEVRKRRSSARGRNQLLIVVASLPERQSSPDPRATPGLELIKSVAREPEPLKCILVSERVEHYLAVQGLTRCEWLAVDCRTNYVEQCLLLARKLAIISGEQSSRPGNMQTSCGAAPGALAEISNAPSIKSSPVPDVMVATTSDEPPAGILQQSDETKDPFALIEVKLPSEARFATVRLEIHQSDQVQKSEVQPLNLNQSAVNELVKDSLALKDRLSKALQDPHKWQRYRERWQADYRALGERVSSLLSPTSFNLLYGMGRGAAGDNVRLRFSLEQPCFDGLWEAIFDGLGQRFMMLDNTVTRRAHLQDTLGIFANEASRPHGLANRISARDGILNVLVIQSNVPDGSAPDGPDDLWKEHWTSLKADLPNLLHLDEEVKVIRELQRARTATGGNARCRRVKVDVLPLRTPRRSWSLADLVEGTLKDPSRNYDIVHFAGHALFATNAKKGDGRGYLIFSGHPNPRAVPIATVASWLEKSGVQLVYLSCCRSSAARAALELARNDVPMTIGFHWDLDDSKAVDFAESFYDELLKTDLKVCQAMRRVRRKLYERHENGDPIWASPVLVAQPMDWIRVERGLQPTARDRRSQPLVQPPPAPRRHVAVSSVVPPPASMHI